MISFRATAKRLDNKILITFETMKNLEVTTTKVITLPNEPANLKSLSNILMTSKEKIEPDDLTASKFKTDFIDYTLSKNYDAVNVDELNAHYNSLFEIDEGDILDNEMHEILSFLNGMVAQTKQNVEAYKKAQENVQTADVPGRDEDQIPKGLQFSLQDKKASDGMQKPKIDLSALSQEQKDHLEQLPSELRAALAGLFGDRLIEPAPLWMQYPGEVVLNNENNAWCVLGRDFGRYGIDGSTGAAAVWLAAGLSPHDTATVEAGGNAGIDSHELLYKRSNLVDDAAYLYLSEKCDTDDLLKVAGGTYVKKTGGPRTGESVAALKADGVVMIARQSGIRLITGTDTKNTAGGNISAKYGIDLIAGNDDSNLQPMVKGTNLVTYLKALSKRLSELQGIVFKFIQGQTEFNTAIGSHSHYDPFLIMLGAAMGGPTTIMGGKCFMSEECATASFKATLAALQDMQSGVNQSINQIGSDLNSLTKVGKYGILSDKNRVN
jgi:hypothetical protein